jgi:hypothetical protein
LSETGKTISRQEKDNFLDKLTQDQQDRKAQFINFFSREYHADNGDKEADKRMYGEPTLERIITFKHLNFTAILTECFQMMNGRIIDEHLILDEVRPDATYFGIEMLRRHRALLAKATPAEEPEPIAPKHLCTTAVMRRLEAGIGSKDYQEIVTRILSAKAELSHGLPIVELTHHVALEIAKQFEPNPQQAPRPKR